MLVKKEIANMKNNLIKYLTIILLLLPIFTLGQGKTQTRLVHWDGIQEITFDSGSVKILNFSGAVNDDAFGQYNITEKNSQKWDDSDSSGNLLPTGVYLYNINYDNISSRFNKLLFIA